MASATNRAAVDRAIAALTSFVAERPHGQLVVELLERKGAGAAAEARLGEDGGVLDDHAAKLGAWRKRAKKKTGAGGATSSWRYFLERYGSLTWLVHGDVDAPTFLPGNVAGAGHALLQLGDDWSADEILGPLLEAKKLEGHGLDEAIVFHGGWGQEGYAFDTRVASAEGEHPIYRFSMDEPLPGLPHERRLGQVRRDKIVPFGVWLEREVARLIKAVRRDLAALQPAEPASGAVPRGKPAAASPRVALPTTAALIARGKLPKDTHEYYRDAAAAEIWLMADMSANHVVVFDGAALTRGRIAPYLKNGPKLLAADRAAMGPRPATSYRVVLEGKKAAAPAAKAKAFVSIEARGRLVRVSRMIAQYLHHEVATTHRTPAKAEAAARALAAKLAPSFSEVAPCKRSFVSFPGGRQVAEPTVTVRGTAVTVERSGGKGSTVHRASSKAALAAQLDRVLDGIATSALLVGLERA